MTWDAQHPVVEVPRWRAAEFLLIACICVAFIASYAVADKTGAFLSLIAFGALLAGLYLRERDPTAPAYVFLGVVLFYLIPKQVLLLWEQVPLLGQNPPADYAEIRYGNLILAIGVIAYHIGYRSIRGRRYRNVAHTAVLSGSLPTVLSALVVSILSLVALTQIVRVSGADLTTLQGFSQEILKERGLDRAYTIFTLLPLCTLFLLYHLSETRLRWIPLLHAFIVLVACGVLTRREPLLFLALGTMAFAGTGRRSVSRTVFAIVATVVIAAAVALVFLRAAAQLGDIDAATFVVSYLYLGEFWVYDMYLVILREAGNANLPWRYGMDLLPGFLDNLIPSLNLPNAPFDEQLASIFKPVINRWVGTPGTIFGMLYANLGLFAVVAGLFMFGLIARGVDIVRKRVNSATAFMAVALGYIWMLFVLRNGDLYHATLLTIKLGIGAALLVALKQLFEAARPLPRRTPA